MREKENMKKEITTLLSNWFFLFSTAFLLIHQIIQKGFQFFLPFLDNYADDFFAMPFILTLFLVEQYSWKRRKEPLSISEITLFTFFFAMFFEFIVPMFNENYTKDYWDFLAYSFGSLAFHSFINSKF